jgi:hypothetical protein
MKRFELLGSDKKTPNAEKNAKIMALLRTGDITRVK